MLGCLSKPLYLLLKLFNVAESLSTRHNLCFHAIVPLTDFDLARPFRVDTFDLALALAAVRTGLSAGAFDLP